MDGFKYDYESFPKWKLTNSEVKVIQGDKDYVRVQVVEPVVYATKEGYDLHIRFLFPETADSNKKYPLIMHVKGSAWMQQHLEGNIGDFYELVKAGYAIAVLRYRPVDVAKFPAQVFDIKEAARFIQEHAAEYPIDMEHVFLSGDSSGGHIAIISYLTWNEDVLDEGDTPLPELRGLTDFYGVSDPEALSKMETGMPLEVNAGIAEMLYEKPASEDPTVLAQGNAICYIDLREDKEPVLIMHGNKDRLVPLSQSISFYEMLKERSVDVRMYMINDADHGHSIFWCEEAKNIVIDFLNEN